MRRHAIMRATRVGADLRSVIGRTAQEDPMEHLTNAEVRALIPDDWRLPCLTMHDVLFTGQANIRQMVRFWRHRAKEHAEDIKRADKLLKALHGKTASDFRALARRFVDPHFPLRGRYVENGHDGPIEPMDGLSRARSAGATTFNVCGWCEHTTGDRQRFNYTISGACEFQKVSGVSPEEHLFDSRCFLPNASGALMGEIRSGLVAARARSVGAKRVVDQKIRVLLPLCTQAEKKPVFPARRPHDWFRVGNKVVFYAACEVNGRHWNEFIPGTVVGGLRHHDGLVYVRLGRIPRWFPRGMDIESGQYNPAIMLAWEFDYLCACAHNNFLHLWARYSVPPTMCFNGDGFVKDIHAHVLSRQRP
ncbi:MAG: hypothetical protein IT406_02195 [Candidatus Yanofskybacteria bacterium]|nr:hypothetical protein [Candidatus Yanofskybacteria bacterium]